eukprot:2444305-Pyramimonas_sp.AAC.1
MFGAPTPRASNMPCQEGASAQLSDQGEVILSDREVMKKTLMRGEPVTFGQDVCDSVRAKKKDTAVGG